MEQDLLHVIFILLALGSALVAICLRLGLPPVIGYLATGLLGGPHLLNWLPDSEATRFMAETGVVMLMFTIGLEFSLPKMLAAKRLVLGLGGMQILLTTLAFGLLAWWLGLSPGAAFLAGAALAMSSTAIALKQLGEQMELGAPHGQAAVGILLAQDLAAVPLLALVPALSGESGNLLLSLGEPLAKALLLFLVMLTLGERLLHPLLRWVASTRSLEMFMLAALLVVISMAAISHQLGLSPAMGAFLAGMVLGESEFRHQVEADIRPFRDLMLGLFFATIGMQLDPNVLWQSPHWILALVAVMLPVKALLVFLPARSFGLAANAAWRAGISLAGAGEFGLLLLALGMGMALFEQNTAQILLTAMVLSMLLAPLLVRWNGRLAALLARQEKPLPGSSEAVSAVGDEFENHVLIGGYGRLGQNLAILLRDFDIDSLALDLDIQRVRQAAAAGEPVAFGNATDSGVLLAAGLRRAKALAITFDDAEQALRVVHQARALHPELPILARCRDATYEERLRQAGAEIFPEGLETSLTYTAQLLVLLGTPPEVVERMMNEIRAEDYAQLRLFFHATDDSESHSSDYHEQRRSLVIMDEDTAVGRTPRELGLDRPPPHLEYIMRGGIRMPGDLLDTPLRAGDILVLHGRPEELDRLEERLHKGGTGQT